MPLLAPICVTVNVKFSTLLPDSKRAVVKDKRLANVCDDTYVFLSRKWNKGVSAY